MIKKKIEDIGSVLSGATPRTNNDDFWNGNIPWVTPKEINKLDSQYLKNTERKITELGFKSCSATMLPVGSILFTSRAPIGLVAIADIDVCTNQGFKSIVLKKEYNSLYVYYYLKSQYRQLNNLGTGTTFKELSKSTFEKFEIPFPEKLIDQIRIAEVLSKTETLIKQRKESIDLLDDFLKSTFLEIFGDPVKNEKDWEKVPLKRFGAIVTGNTPPRNNSSNFSSNYIEWIKTDNISSDNTIITTAKEYLSKEGLLKSRFVEKGALLVACIAGSIESVGRASLTDRTVSFNQQINAIQPNNSINSYFLYWLFKNSKVYIQNHSTKGMKKILTKGLFEKILMIKPPIVLQNKFASKVEKAEVLKRQYKESLQELENLFGSLSQKVFKGELDLSKSDVSSQIGEIEKKIEVENGLDISFERKLTKSMGNFIKQTQDLQKSIDLVPNVLQKQIEMINKSAEPFQKLNKIQIPEQLLQAMESFEKFKLISAGYNDKPIVKKDKITWEEINFQQVSAWIREKYNNYHFSSEMLYRFLVEEHVTFPNYHSSEELKINYKLSEADDLKSFVFSALNNENQFIKLEQFFYDAVSENIQLKLHDEDYALIKDKEKRFRSGIYLKITE